LVSDKEILLLFKNNATKERALKLIMDKYQLRLYAHIRRMVVLHADADDVLQNTFIKIWKGLDRFKSESQLYTWLYRIASNESLTFLAQKKKKYATSLQDVEHDLSNRIAADSDFDGDALQLKLQQALLTLPEKQRQTFNMRYFDDLKYDEISKILETSVGALKANYHHAVKKIENYFAEH